METEKGRGGRPAMPKDKNSRFGLDPAEKRCVELVREYQNGNKEAFDHIVDYMSGKFYYTVFKTINDEYESQDVLQEIWIRIARNIGSLKDPEAFKKWSYSIVHTVMMDYLKAQNVRGRYNTDLGLEDSLEFIPNEKQGGEADILQVERRASVLAAVETLPKELQLMIRSRYYENLSEKEIAEVYGTSESTVFRKLAAARKQLKGRLVGVRSVVPFFFYRLEAGRESRRLAAAAGMTTGVASVQKAAVAGGIAAGAAAAVILQGPSIQNLRYYDQGQYVNNQRVEWTVDSALPVKSVLVEGKPWKVTAENGIYRVDIPENGECVIRVTNAAGLSCERSVSISNIDSEAPEYLGFEENGNTMILNFGDTLSGINWEQTVFTKESGEQAEIAAIDRGKGEVLLKKEDFPMQARVEDHAGNFGIYSMNLRTVKRPAITQGGERNAQ